MSDSATRSKPFSRRDFLKTASLSLPLLAGGGCAALSSRSSPHPRDFVSIRNSRFERAGRSYFYVGANLWYGGYLGAPDLPGGRRRLVRELDRLRAIGVTNLRLLAGSETSALAGSIPHGITRRPRDWDQPLLEGLDFCLAEMARRDITGVLYLTNYWQWSGGMAQYVNWISGEPIPDPDRPEVAAGPWQDFMRYSARFYRTPAAQDLFQEYVRGLLARRNTCNGRTYRDDPAIMAWELANEPRPGTDADPARLAAFYDWVDLTARRLHSLDPNHLVTTGTEGIHGCLEQPEIFLKAHQSPAIDYVNVHLWLKNWSWLKEPRLGPQYEEAVTRGCGHIEQHIALATDSLRKPLTMEEFGIARDGESYAPASGVTMRDDYYGRMFQVLVDSCRAGRALQGVNFWAWAGEGRPQPGRSEAAALMGDPLSEPQGLNSVLDTDRSTHSIIAQFNQKLRALT
jgi:mannan endo-1,4-beta-mannosidase